MGVRGSLRSFCLEVLEVPAVRIFTSALVCTPKGFQRCAHERLFAGVKVRAAASLSQRRKSKALLPKVCPKFN